jgi:hypothetical protein
MLMGASAGRTNGGAASTIADERKMTTILRIIRAVACLGFGDSVDAILPTIVVCCAYVFVR